MAGSRAAAWTWLVRNPGMARKSQTGAPPPRAIWSGGDRDTDVAATVISPDTTTLNSGAVIHFADLDASWGWPENGWNPRRRRLLPTTNTEENAIAAPASIGLSRPAAASGIAATL